MESAVLITALGFGAAYHVYQYNTNPQYRAAGTTFVDAMESSVDAVIEYGAGLFANSFDDYWDKAEDIYQKPQSGIKIGYLEGGIDQSIEDFNLIEGKLTTHENGTKVKVQPDGSKAVWRPKSTGDTQVDGKTGEPTIEYQTKNGNTKKKIRYKETENNGK